MKQILRSAYFWLVLGIVFLGGSFYWAITENTKKEAEIQRLEKIQTTLLGEVEHFRTKNGELVASVQAISLKRDEFEELFKAEKAKVKNLGVRLKDLESIGETSTETNVTIEAEILPPDTIYLQEPIVGKFEWEDAWVSIRGELHPNIVKAQINITDTITIVAHRKPRGWWIFKCKGKIVRYEALSSNPYTQIKDVKYIEVGD